MKRKVTVFLLAVLLLAAMALPALADIAWEPYGDLFYETHRDEMSRVERGYLANGSGGYVTLRSAPDSLVEVKNVPNGEYLYIGMVWADKDGTLWGVGEFYEEKADGGRRWVTYWAAMDELALVYDRTSFQEDHGAEFKAYDGSGDHLTKVCLYTYPNGVYSYTLEQNEGYMTFAEGFQDLYTDENGLRWTYIGYYMGRTNSWACIDDPLNESLGTDGYLTVGQVRGGEALVPPTDEVPPSEDGEPSTLPAPEDPEPTEKLIPPAETVPPAKTWVVWAIPAALVVLAAAVTAVIVRKKRKKG